MSDSHTIYMRGWRERNRAAINARTREHRAMPIDMDRLVEASPRFWPKVNKTSACWVWTGTVKFGYGVFSIGSKRIQAHRFAYLTTSGPIGEGPELDHLCRNRACVRPSHLEAVTGRINRLRGDSPVGINARKTHCTMGHEFTEGNTYIRPKTGTRACKTCGRTETRRLRRALAAAR